MTDYLDNSNKQMKLAMMFVTGYGNESYAWRLADSNERAYTDIDNYIKLAQIAEQGKIHTLFVADTPAMVGAGVSGDFAQKSPMFVLEPMTILSAVATHTQKIGLVATYSTTYNLPYNLARQLKRWTLSVVGVWAGMPLPQAQKKWLTILATSPCLTPPLAMK